MPKKVEKKSALDMITWIEKLPDGGGAWGKGIVETVMTFESEASTLDTEIVSLVAQVQALKDRAAQRRSMALQAARRASREAPKLFEAEVLAKVLPVGE